MEEAKKISRRDANGYRSSSGFCISRRKGLAKNKVVRS